MTQPPPSKLRCSFKHRFVWCFFVLRCLIYKVHAPTAERILGYHILSGLSRLFFVFRVLSSLSTEEEKPLPESRSLLRTGRILAYHSPNCKPYFPFSPFSGILLKSVPLIMDITVKNIRGARLSPDSPPLLISLPQPLQPMPSIWHSRAISAEQSIVYNSFFCDFVLIKDDPILTFSQQKCKCNVFQRFFLSCGHDGAILYN